MISIIQGQNGGKTIELFKAARANKAIIVTQNKKTLKAKAREAGYSDISIIDYNDLARDCFALTKPIIAHNGDKLLNYLLSQFYNIELIGMTTTALD